MIAHLKYMIVMMLKIPMYYVIECFFDDFPVYKTTDVEEIKFFIRGLGLHRAKISEGNIRDRIKKLKKGDIE